MSDYKGEIKWRSMSEKPDIDRECLCKMKHGIIAAYYQDNGRFSGYYWREIEFDAKYWCYLDEIHFTQPTTKE
jgi:hypothetical protein